MNTKAEDIFKLSKPKRKKNKKDNPVLNERKFNEFFEIRKERIGIIFKVIYVIAAFFLASVMALQGNEDAGISTVYIIESCTRRAPAEQLPRSPSRRAGQSSYTDGWAPERKHG